MNGVIKTVVSWLVIVLGAFLLWHQTRSGATANQTVPEISYSDFLARVANNQVKTVRIAGTVVRGSGTDGSGFSVILPRNNSAALDALQQHGVEIWFKEAAEQSWPNWIANLAPLFRSGLCGFL